MGCPHQGRSGGLNAAIMSRPLNSPRLTGWKQLLAANWDALRGSTAHDQVRIIECPDSALHLPRFDTGPSTRAGHARAKRRPELNDGRPTHARENASFGGHRNERRRITFRLRSLQWRKQPRLVWQPDRRRHVSWIEGGLDFSDSAGRHGGGDKHGDAYQHVTTRRARR